MSEMSANLAGRQPRLRAAVEKLRSKMEAIESSELSQVLIDPLTAATTVRGAYPKIIKFRDAMVALSGFDADNIDQLETYALAAHATQTRMLASSTPPEDFAKIVEETTELRAQFVSDATTLARRGLIDDVPLGLLKGTTGYKNIASDVMTLSTIFRDAWPRIVGKACVTEEELDHAEVLSDVLINDVGIREQSPAAKAASALERQQAFTLFTNAYDQVRRALTYLRWSEGDVDDIAPSLYSGRKKRAVSTEVVPDVTEPPAVDAHVDP
jgi:hypothetical protein